MKSQVESTLDSIYNIALDRVIVQGEKRFGIHFLELGGYTLTRPTGESIRITLGDASVTAYHTAPTEVVGEMDLEPFKRLLWDYNHKNALAKWSTHAQMRGVRVSV